MSSNIALKLWIKKDRENKARSLERKIPRQILGPCLDSQSEERKYDTMKN